MKPGHQVNARAEGDSESVSDAQRDRINLNHKFETKCLALQHWLDMFGSFLVGAHDDAHKGRASPLISSDLEEDTIHRRDSYNTSKYTLVCLVSVLVLGLSITRRPT